MTDKEYEELDLSQFSKDKKWIIFGIKGCFGCFETKKYFEANGIPHKYYDVRTRDGMTEAVIRGVLDECKNAVPVIIEDNE